MTADFEIRIHLADGGAHAWRPDLPDGAIVARVEVLGPGGLPAGEIDYQPPAYSMPEPEWHRGCTGCWRTVWHTS